MDIEGYFVIAGYIYFVFQFTHLRFKNEMRIWRWLTNSEKDYRNEKFQNGYPQDWQYRRIAVYRRDKGKCGICGRKIGRLRLWTRTLEQSGLSGNAELHVHHIIPISQNGNHELKNLKLLCFDCHAKQHPQSRFFLETRGNASRCWMP